ncbi:MAG: proline iminopeptidase-family hydrolase [Alphaproteobacteria bacterium]|nr:proline iminopeptidase-family hydrolase [Alphaproteobacteria bacterium]
MAREGFITISTGHRIWYKIVGDGSGVPLLTLHGGPGAGHDYLEPLEALGNGRPVIFYDQLGCGKSDKPDARPMWTIERFADEIDEVRAALGLERIHLLGQSWGGWLGIEYLLRQPAGIVSAVLASTSASIPQFTRECERLIGEMPEEMQRALREHGLTGNYADPGYQAAMMEFYKRHLCRLPEWPDCVMRTVANLDGNQVYDTINGPNEFTTIGNLRYWNRIPDLHQIRVPVLLTCGRYDELGEVCSRTILDRIADGRLEIFEHSAHVAHAEEPDAYNNTVAAFFRAVENRG